ncbi:MAG: sulfatase-like hydrolase/transferase [Rubinisphaera brasiliensis]|uniref:sulfatase-like hydrolase/transferase n=1 Tax=Rubinisphaera brasiliensis TaxID=119 RepID=UPI003918888A
MSTLSAQAADRPNILWITSEDNGIELGCYGDDYADTPNIDKLAEKGMRYNYCWSNAPVCAPARTTIISGMYPTSLGAQHMRSQQPMPQGMKMYPQYLREAGYYCTNNSKEDYNLEKPGQVWDDSSRKAHWKNRKDGQPFFAIFNHTVSHESQLRKRPHTAVHDPAKAPIPAYHPDIPESRQDWAQYYDKLTEMDEKVGQNLQELAEAGLMEDTIIFYYGDHGSGMPRHKRWPYNSGLHVPLVVHFPEKYKDLAPEEYTTGGASDRLVSFVDLAPTLLSLCGVKPPQEWQGHAFAGKFETEDQPYIFGFRGRMDERIDMVRSMRNERFMYIRHFYPHRPYGQFVHYMFQTPTTRKWYQMHLDGQLTDAQDLFWRTKPVEELYDLQADPDEINSLVDDPQYAETLKEMREVLGKKMQETRDVGIVPEAEMNQVCDGKSPYDLVRQGKLTGDYDRAIAAAFLATRATADEVTDEALVNALSDDQATVRYWATIFTLREGEQVVPEVRSHLLDRLDDSSSSVRVIAAETLATYGQEEDLARSLDVLVKAADLRQSDVYTAIAAWNSLDELGDKAASVRDRLAELPEQAKGTPGRMSSYIPRLKQKTLADLDGKPLP